MRNLKIMKANQSSTKELLNKENEIFELIKPMLNEKQIKDIENAGVDCLILYGNQPEHFEIYKKYDFKYWRSLRYLKINNLIYQNEETINKFLNIIDTYGKDSLFVSLIQRVVECNTKLQDLGMSPYIYFDDFMNFIEENKKDILNVKENGGTSKSTSRDFYIENCVLNWLASFEKKEHIMLYENMVAPYFASYTETKL
jgi:hypothetical protein